MLLDEQLEQLIDEMPESAHKFKIMKGANRLIKFLKIPEPLRDNATLMQFIAEFSLSFLTAVGFSTAQKATEGEENPTLNITGVFFAINVLIPFIFNTVLKIKRTGYSRFINLPIHTAAQYTATLAFIATFNQSINMISSPNTLEDEIKDCMVVALASLFTVRHSYTVTKTILDRILHVAYRSPEEYRSIFYEDMQFQKTKEIILSHTNTEELYLLVAVFIMAIFGVNQGAKQFMEDTNISPYQLNIVVLPTIYAIISILRVIWLYLTAPAKNIQVVTPV
jgi:hypothetical protein